MTTTSVLEIIATVEASCDWGDFPDDDDERAEFWLDCIASKAGDTGFGHLVDAILENGWHPDSCVGWDDEAKEITEGHHRLVAAILLAMDFVPTSPWGETAYDVNGDGGELVCAHYNFDNPSPIDLD